MIPWLLSILLALRLKSGESRVIEGKTEHEISIDQAGNSVHYPRWIQHHRHDSGHTSLLRKEEAGEVKTGSGIEEDFRTPSFMPQIQACQAVSAASKADESAAVLQLKRMLAKFGVPLILKSELLLAWRQSCSLGQVSESSVATFGPWLEKAGLAEMKHSFEEEGHQFNMSTCKDGPLSPGCEIAITLKTASQAGRRMLLQVLFWANSPSQGGPGVFAECDRAICGAKCGRCSIAYPLRSSDGVTACPTPSLNFELASWMNETFWIPAETNLYLDAEFGRGWETKQLGTPSRNSCDQYIHSKPSSFRTQISGLPEAAVVLQSQQTAETNLVRHNATHPAALWQPSLPNVNVNIESVRNHPWVQSRLPQKDFSSRAQAAFGILADLLDYCMFVTIAVLLVAGSLIFNAFTAHAQIQMQVFFSRKVLGNSLQIMCQLMLMAAVMLCQFKTGSGYSLLNATVIVYFLRYALSALVIICDGSDDITELLQTEQRHVGGLPPIVLTIVPGILFALRDWMSFVSLQSWDPVSVAIVMSAKGMLLNFLHQVTGQKPLISLQWLSAGMLAVVCLIKGMDRELEKDSIDNRGATAAVCQLLASTAGTVAYQFFLKNVEVPELVLSASCSFQGLLALLVVVACRDPVSSEVLREFFSAEAISSFVNDGWLCAAVLCMVILSLVAVDDIAEARHHVEEMNRFFLIPILAMLVWIVFGWTGSNFVSMQAVFMSLLVLGMFYTAALGSTAPKKAISKTLSWAAPKAAAQATSKSLSAAAPKAAPKAAAPKAAAPKPALQTRAAPTAAAFKTMAAPTVKAKLRTPASQPAPVPQPTRTLHQFAPGGWAVQGQRMAPPLEAARKTSVSAPSASLPVEAARSSLTSAPSVSYVPKPMAPPLEAARKASVSAPSASLQFEAVRSTLTSAPSASDVPKPSLSLKGRPSSGLQEHVLDSDKKSRAPMVSVSEAVEKLETGHRKRGKGSGVPYA